MLCAVALVLLMDGSDSMSVPDWEVQKEQTAQALESVEVIEAIERQGAIAVRAAPFDTTIRGATPWRILQNRLDAYAFASEVRTLRAFGGLTNIAGVLSEAQDSFEEVPCVADSRIIDLGTDGIDQEDRTAEARDAIQMEGTRINVIAVTDSEDWADRLQRSAVTGDGFFLVATDWSEYPQLFRRKIVLEIAGLLP